MNQIRNFLHRAVERGALVFALTVLALASAVGHALLHDRLVSGVLEASLLVALSATLFYAGYRIRASGLTSYDVATVFGVSLAFAAATVTIVGGYLLARFLQGDVFEELVFVVTVALFAGANAGLPVGYYYTRLSEELEEFTKLNKLTRVNQRVLRHNLRNELTVLFGCVDGIADGADTEHYLDLMQSHFTRVHELSETAQLLGHIWEVDLTEERDLTWSARNLVESFELAYQDVEFHLEVEPGATDITHVDAEEGLWEAVSNAVVHNPRPLRVDVTVTCDDRFVTFEVADDRRGVPDLELRALELQEEIQLTHGTGLGLWVIFWVVEKSGGRCHFSRNDRGGTTVAMQFARSEREMVRRGETLVRAPRDAS